MSKVIVHYANQRQGYALTKDTVIGRTAGCDLVFNLKSVSRRHSCIYRSDGRWVIKDLGSTNGTWVNGRRIREPHILAGGDEIRVGTVGLTYPAPAQRPRLKRVAAQRILFGCPGCQQQLKAPLEKAGSHGKCKSCGIRFVVPNVSGGRARPLEPLSPRRPPTPTGRPQTSPAAHQEGRADEVAQAHYDATATGPRDRTAGPEPQVVQDERPARASRDVAATSRTSTPDHHAQPLSHPDAAVPALGRPEPVWRGRDSADVDSQAAVESKRSLGASFDIGSTDLCGDLSLAEEPIDEPDQVHGQWFAHLDVWPTITEQTTTDVFSDDWSLTRRVAFDTDSIDPPHDLSVAEEPVDEPDRVDGQRSAHLDVWPAIAEQTVTDVLSDDWSSTRRSTFDTDSVDEAPCDRRWAEESVSEPDRIDSRWLLHLDVWPEATQDSQSAATPMRDARPAGHRTKWTADRDEAAIRRVELAADIWPVAMFGQAVVAPEMTVAGQLSPAIGLEAIASPLDETDELDDVNNDELDWWGDAVVVQEDLPEAPSPAIMARAVAPLGRALRRALGRHRPGADRGESDQPSADAAGIDQLITATTPDGVATRPSKAPGQGAGDSFATEWSDDATTATEAIDDDEGTDDPAEPVGPEVCELCALCHEPITTRSFNITCPVCGSNHHAPCWLKNSGCAALRCPAAHRPDKQPEQAPAETATDDDEYVQAVVVDEPQTPATPIEHVPETEPDDIDVYADDDSIDTPGFLDRGPDIRLLTDTTPWDVFLLVASLVAFTVGMVTAGIPNMIVLPIAIVRKVVRRRRFSNSLFWLIVALSAIGIPLGILFTRYFFGTTEF